jgi:hypothetical protein
MVMAFITKANSKRILRKVNINAIPDIYDDVYKEPINCFSRWEIKNLLVMKSFLKNPEKFFIEIYDPIINSDTFTYIFESEQSPSYHSSINCPRLKSKFRNFVIPFEIRDRVSKRLLAEGKNQEEINDAVKTQIDRFREWFKINIDLFNNEPEGFLTKLDREWNVLRNPEEIERDNSGAESIDNLNLEELELEIGKIMENAGKYFVNNKDKQNIIRRFQKLTFLAYKAEEIDINDTALSDEDLKAFLKEYDEQFKRPIKELLIQYYRIQYNPDLSFEGDLLEKLNFRCCSACEGRSDIDDIDDSTLSSTDDLHF